MMTKKFLDGRRHSPFPNGRLFLAVVILGIIGFVCSGTIYSLAWLSSSSGSGPVLVSSDAPVVVKTLRVVDVGLPPPNTTLPPINNGTLNTTCLDPSGPQPYILMSLGRSGSGSTWQIIGSLTGRQTPSEEYTGSSTEESKAFFEKHNGNDDQWLLQYLCNVQKKYPQAKVVGFKWKPWKPIFKAPAAIAGLKTMATLQEPRIKVVRLRRNLLDVIISREKHATHKVVAHCSKDDVECIEAGINASKGVNLYGGKMKQLLKSQEKLHDNEDRVDKLLLEMNVPHVQVKYERLYNVDGKGGDTEEWEKIFAFLGIGPAKGLAQKQLEGAMEHGVTHPPTHNETLANYDEVAEALRGTKFETLLH